MNDVLRRLEILRLDGGVKAVALCEHLGIAKSTYSSWKNRDVEPDTKYIPQLADFFGVSCDYLLIGKEPTLSELESEIVSLYKTLNDEGKQLLLQRASELKQLGYIKNSETGVVGA